MESGAWLMLLRTASHRIVALQRTGLLCSARAGRDRSLSSQSAGAMAAVKDQITLTPQEEELFGTLLAAAQHAGTGTVLRCAGGWVRDKLLGKDSDDIDIALDNMLGRDFANKVPVQGDDRTPPLAPAISSQPGTLLHTRTPQPQCTRGAAPYPAPGSPPRAALPALPSPPLHPGQVNEYLASQGKEVRTAAVIQSNPEQSKHLETARMKVRGRVVLDRGWDACLLVCVGGGAFRDGTGGSPLLYPRNPGQQPVG